MRPNQLQYLVETHGTTVAIRRARAAGEPDHQILNIASQSWLSWAKQQELRNELKNGPPKWSQVDIADFIS